MNLVDRVVEVYRNPAPEASAPSGWAYRTVATLTPPAVVVPLGLGDVQVAVADLLP